MITTQLRRTLAALFAFFLTLGAQAAPESPRSNHVLWENLPAAVQKTLLEVTQGATIREISLVPATYTARIDSKGQKSEVRVTDTGKVLRSRSKHEAEALFEEEQRLAQSGKLKTIPLAELSPMARAVITEAAKGGKLDQIVKAPATYTAVVDRGSETSEVKVTDEGNALAAAPSPGAPSGSATEGGIKP